MKGQRKQYFGVQFLERKPQLPAKNGKILKLFKYSSFFFLQVGLKRILDMLLHTPGPCNIPKISFTIFFSGPELIVNEEFTSPI